MLGQASRVLGYSATEAAVALHPLAVGGLVFATVAGRLLPRTGCKPLLIVGLTVYVAGLGLMATIDSGSGYWPHILVAILLAVAGNSITFVAANVVALALARMEEQSLVGGLFNTGMQVGGGLGLAVMSAVAAGRIGAAESGEALLSGDQAALKTAAGIAAGFAGHRGLPPSHWFANVSPGFGLRAERRIGISRSPDLASLTAPVRSA